MLVPAHPLHAHGLPDELGHQRGIGGRVVGAILAVATRALDVDDPDLGGRKPEGVRNGLLQRVYARVPDQTVAWIPSHRAGVTFATHEGPTGIMW
jgi:hypothetical protein